MACGNGMQTYTVNRISYTQLMLAIIVRIGSSPMLPGIYIWFGLESSLIVCSSELQSIPLSRTGFELFEHRSIRINRSHRIASITGVG